MKRIAVATVVALGLVGSAAGRAEAKQYRYVGVHPIGTDADDGFCYIEVAHVHVFAPKRVKVMYRVVDDHNHFVGDPVAFGYDGPRHAYVGHHPVDVTVAVPHLHIEPPSAAIHCYIDGPHFHHYEPPPALRFEVKAGAHVYVGPYEPNYEVERRQYIAINPIVTRIDYERPEVEVVDEVELRAGFEVHVPAPTLEVQVGIPGVIVTSEHHHHHSHVKHKKHKKHKRHKHGRKLLRRRH